MTSKFVDLHVHTTFSDSTFTPDEVINAAKEEGLSALGITDHDSVSSLTAITRLGEKAGIEIVPGVELSAEENGQEIHILGYYISLEEDWFKKKLKKFYQAREERAREITKRLKAIGIDLDFGIVKEMSGEGAMGRMHIARALTRVGYVKHPQAAFRLYLTEGKPAYVKKFPLSPEEAIEMIKSLKGISCLAHPGLLKNNELILNIIKYGIDGIEVFHTDHSTTKTNYFLELASLHKLLVTGGSDCHGIGKGKQLLGTIKLPYKYLSALKERKGI